MRSMSFNTVQKNHPQAAKLFQVLSFLNPDGVLIGFLQSGIKGLPNDLQAMVASHIDLAKALLECGFCKSSQELTWWIWLL